MSKKSRFLGGLVGAGAVRGGTDSIFSETGGPLRFDDPTYGALATGMSMGPYSANGITLSNTSGSSAKMALDFDLAGFTGDFYIELANVPDGTEMGVVAYNYSQFSSFLTNGLSLGTYQGGGHIRHTSGGFQAQIGSASYSGTRNVTATTMVMAYKSSTKEVLFGYKFAGASQNPYWLEGSNLTNQTTSGSWSGSAFSDPTWTIDPAHGSGYAETLWITLPANSSCTYYAENWEAPNASTYGDELRLSTYSSGTTDYTRTTPKSGILTLDEVGPEDNGTSLSLSQMNWGGISGRSAVIDTTNPSLDLNFDGQTSSFTRATTAADAAKANGDQLATSIVTQNKTGTVQSKYMGPDGKLINGYVTNLMPYSEDLSNYSLLTFASPDPDTAVAPDGTTTADSLVEDTTASNVHYARNTISVTSGTTYTYSVYVKANTRDHVRVVLGDANNAFPSGDTGINVDLTDGSYTGGTALDASSVTSVGNGWWRVSVTSTAASTTNGYAYVFLHDGTSASYTGDGTSSIYVWGSQLEESAVANQYVSTIGASASDQVARIEYDASGNPLGLLVEEQRTNIYPGTVPTNNKITFTTNQGTAPDGTNTAIKATEDSALGEKDAGTAGFDITSGKQYTASLFAKPNGRPGIRLLLPGAHFGDNLIAHYDLQGNGSILEWGGTNAPDATTITPAGNGWYRISITGTASSTANTYLQLVIDDDATDTNTSYQGDGSSGLLIWGIQVEEGEGATSYIPTTSGSVTRLKDVITVSTSDFGYDLTHTVALDATLNSKSIATFPYLVGQWDGTANNRDVLSVNVGGGTLYLNASDGGTLQISQAIVSGVTYPYTTKLAYGYHGTEAPNAENGVLGAEKTRNAAPVNARTDFVLGGNGNPNMHLRRFTYWPRAISDEQLAEYSYDLNFGGRMEYHGILSLNEVAQSRR